MLFIHGSGLSRHTLHSIPVPATPRWAETSVNWAPINHGVLADTLIARATAAGMEVVDEQWIVNATGSDLFGSVDLRSPVALPDGVGLSIGLRHSNAGRYAVTLGVGGRVFVCSNGIFVSDITLSRKHTLGLKVGDLVDQGLERYLGASGDLLHFVDAMRARELAPKEVDHLLLEAGRRDVLPWGQIRTVDAEWRKPRHAAFRPRTAWSLYNAFTEVVKGRGPAAQYRSLQKLAPLFTQDALERLAA